MDLDLARIEKAMQVIDPVFLHTPQYVDEQLCQALGGRAVTVKVETANPVRSFKGRGADLMLSTLAPGTLWCARVRATSGRPSLMRDGLAGCRSKCSCPRRSIPASGNG
ncbi:hypothetical protein [Actinomadura madurae]|uniref:hypothetical protein n=1 Tax=Actinomadura madurae TaxID=1993 RepID=UPI0021087CCF|nr:hypothetical protein [Actinomadura madurae]